MEIGNKILALRKQHNMSQEQLAEKINVSRQTISNWELGETSPDLNQAQYLSKIFNTSLDELTNNEIQNILLDRIVTQDKDLNINPYEYTNFDSLFKAIKNNVTSRNGICN